MRSYVARLAKTQTGAGVHGGGEEYWDDAHGICITWEPAEETAKVEVPPVKKEEPVLQLHEFKMDVSKVTYPTSGWEVGERVFNPSTEERGEVTGVSPKYLTVKLDGGGNIKFEPKYLKREP